MGRTYCLFLILIMFSGVAFSYPTPVDVDGSLHRWPIDAGAPNVYYDVVVADESYRPFLQPVVDASADLWTNVGNSLIVLTAADSSHSSQISVHFESSIAGGNMAAGYSIFDEIKNNVPVHCSVHIAVDDSTDYENLHKTTLHELGHCLGLAHSLMASSIMSYQLEKNSFALALDDEAALSRLYPLDGSDAKLAPGCAIGQSPQPRAQPAVLIAVLLFPWAVFYAARFLRDLVRN